MPTLTVIRLATFTSAVTLLAEGNGEAAPATGPLIGFALVAIVALLVLGGATLFDRTGRRRLSPRTGDRARRT